MEEDYEAALANLFPAIDKTAKKRYPNSNVGERIRKFLNDEMWLMTLLGTGHIIQNVVSDGLSLEQALYKYGRTSLMHEGELDPRLSISSDGGFSFGSLGMFIPPEFIMGMTAAVVTSPENRNEKMKIKFSFELYEYTIELNELWGNHDHIKNIAQARFKCLI